MCIYYGNKEELTYNTKEHIFPAAIGGIAKLPKGVVSDQFNNEISKLERIVIKNSLIGFARVLEGPGKRGKLSEKHAAKSDICLIENSEDKGKFALGYTQKDKVCEISHCVFNINEGTGSFSFPKGGGIELFKEKCSEVNFSRVKILDYDNIPFDIVIFGIEKGIEKNYDYFLAKNSTTEFNLSPEKIKVIGDALSTIGEPQKINYKPIVSGKLFMSVDQLRIYAKIAFNYLALLKGKEYMSDSRLDSIREWISNGGDNYFADLGNTEADLLNKMGVVFPEAFHFVVLHTNERGLWAKVYLYNSIYIDVRLSETSFPDILIEGFICDWKNKKEYRFRDYLDQTKQQGY